MLRRMILLLLLAVLAGSRASAQRTLYSEFDTTVFTFIGARVLWDTLQYPYRHYRMVAVGKAGTGGQLDPEGWIVPEKEGIIVLGLMDGRSNKIVVRDTFYAKRPPDPKVCVGTYCEAGRIPLHYLKLQKGLMVRLDSYRYTGFSVLSFDVLLFKGNTGIAQYTNRGPYFDTGLRTMLQQLTPGMKVVFQAKGAGPGGSVRQLDTLELEVY